MKAALSAALSASEKAAFVLSPVFFARGYERSAVFLVSGAAILAAIGSRARSAHRVQLRAARYADANRALLRARAASLPLEEPLAVLMDGAQQGAELEADVAPRAVGGAVGGILGLALLGVYAPAWLSAAFALLAVSVGGFVVLTRGALARAVALEWKAQKPVLDASEAAVFSRDEIVAEGAVPQHEARLALALDGWQRATFRTERVATWLARFPLALMSAASVAPFALHLVPSPKPADIALVVATAAVLLGGIRALHDAFRTRAASQPLRRLLGAEMEEDEVVPRADAIALDATDVSFRYGEGASVFSGVSFRAERGAVTLVEGPNGSGKSTLLRLVVRLAHPTDGSLAWRFADGETGAIPQRARLAYLPQRVQMPRFGTVDDAFALVAPESGAEQRCRSLCEAGLALDMGAARVLLGRLVSELSAGQRQRVAIARLLARTPNVVVLDEPDGWLDAEGLALVAKLIATWRATAIVILAAHRPELVRLADARVDLSLPVASRARLAARVS